MSYAEEDYLQLSGIQHYVFCRRQWALIHIEKLWQENLRTTDGALMHEKVHDASVRESRGDIFIVRSMSVASRTLGVSGKCDAVEFRKSSGGVSIGGREGLYTPYPVEYKRGAPKPDPSDKMQLCCQAMCLEEMLCCSLPSGALFYGETKHREAVEFTAELRDNVKRATIEMHDMYSRGYTPKAKPTKSCNACSLKELCIPKLLRSGSVRGYIEAALENAP